MDLIIPALIFGQALGALFGAGAAVWGEFAYVYALKDGRIDDAERAHLEVIGKGLKFGMSLILLSSIGLVISAYVVGGTPQPVLTDSYWILMVLSLIVIGVSWALSHKHMSFFVATAIAFTAWWFLVYLTFGQLPTDTFGATMAFFVVAAVIFSGILFSNRKLSTHR